MVIRIVRDVPPPVWFRIVPDAPEYGVSAPSAVRRFSAEAIECAKAIAFVLSWQ
jgi:hypothetical protein